MVSKEHVLLLEEKKFLKCLPYFKLELLIISVLQGKKVLNLDLSLNFLTSLDLDSLSPK
jgi:hypothetical protein